MSKKAASPRTGRPAIFRPKDRVHGIRAFMTATGKKALGEAKKRLAFLTGWKAKDISDGDVVEYLARGDEATVTYLAATDQLRFRGGAPPGK